MSRAARLWRLSAWLGVATLVLGGVLLAVLPRGRQGLADGFATPIVAFEFANSEAEVRALVLPRDGSPDTGGGSPRMRAFDLGNRLDFAFLLLYGAFVFTAALAVVEGSRSGEGPRTTGRARLALPLSVLASAADAYENVQLLSLTAGVRAGHDLTAALQRLAVATWVKWGSVLVAFVALSPWLWQRGRAGKFVVASNAVAIVGAALSPRCRGLAHEVMANAVFAMFVGLLVVAWRRKREASRAPNQSPSDGL